MRMNNLVLGFLFVFIAGCNATKNISEALSLEEYKRAFISDCHRIKTIYEDHGGSGYYYENFLRGNRTNYGVSLKEMRGWLSQCGVDISNVQQIME